MVGFRKRRAEAPLALILAGVAAFTALSVMVRGLLHKSNTGPAAPANTRYLQSLEGVMNRYGQRGNAHSLTRSSTAGESDGGFTSGGSSTSASGAVHQEVLRTLSASDIVIRRLDPVHGDFVYSRSRGWLRYDPQSLNFVSVRWNDLPEDFKDRYAGEIFSDGGLGSGAHEGGGLAQLAAQSAGRLAAASHGGTGDGGSYGGGGEGGFGGGSGGMSGSEMAAGSGSGSATGGGLYASAGRMGTGSGSGSGTAMGSPYGGFSHAGPGTTVSGSALPGAPGSGSDPTSDEAVAYRTTARLNPALPQ